MKSAIPLLLAPLVAAVPADVSSRQAAQSIHEAFVAAGKEFFGTATDQALLERESNAPIIQANFGQVTGENSMKWGSLEANRGQFNWGPADFLADWATTNGQIIRGHTLIWHSQLPTWVEAITDAEELRGIIREHVATVVGRYAGQIAQWVS
jgi:endo-1,4-beta-xylanase